MTASPDAKTQKAQLKSNAWLRGILQREVQIESKTNGYSDVSEVLIEMYIILSIETTAGVLKKFKIQNQPTKDGTPNLLAVISTLL